MYHVSLNVCVQCKPGVNTDIVDQSTEELEQKPFTVDSVELESPNNHNAWSLVMANFH